jgi:Hypoxia induced protein conserved region
MDLFVVVIIAAMLLTVGTVLLGVMSMSAGGSTDNNSFSTSLMWARVGFSVLTLVLLFIAARLR